MTWSWQIQAYIYNLWVASAVICQLSCVQLSMCVALRSLVSTGKSDLFNVVSGLRKMQRLGQKNVLKNYLPK